MRLPIRREAPYYVRIGGGASIGYRRNNGPGTWVVRLYDADGKRTVKVIAQANDEAKADGKAVLDYVQACDAARRLARGETAEAPKAIVSLGDALDQYEEDLRRRGSDLVNVSRVRRHMTAAMLTRPLALMDYLEFRGWRDALAKKLSTAAVDRTCRGLKAACNLAAEGDARLDKHAWTSGLALINEKSPQRHHVPLAEPIIAEIVRAARAQSTEFGNLVQVLAETGCRYSQAIRILICDLLPDDMLNIPVSRKGRGRKEIASCQLPISPRLTARLRLAAGARQVTEELLLRSDGKPWRHSDETDRFANAVAAAGQDATKVFAYSLRHSWIINRLLANVPARLVASCADTSLAMLERTYSRFISQGSDVVMRGTLPNVEPVEVEAEVVPIRR